MLSGPVILKIANAAPVTMKGEWNISRGIPVTRHYGQGQLGNDGNVKPGSGYLGSAHGTMQNVRGSFRFAIDETGESVQNTVMRGQYQFFTMNWPVGDPASATVKATAVDCHFDEINFEHNGPEGRYEITGTMSAGMVDGLEPADI